MNFSFSFGSKDGATAPATPDANTPVQQPVQPATETPTTAEPTEPTISPAGFAPAGGFSAPLSPEPVSSSVPAKPSQPMPAQPIPATPASGFSAPAQTPPPVQPTPPVSEQASSQPAAEFVPSSAPTTPVADSVTTQKPEEKKPAFDAGAVIQKIWKKFLGESTAVTQDQINVKMGIIFLFSLAGFVFYRANWYMDQYKLPVLPIESLTSVQTLEGYEQEVTSIIPYNGFQSYMGIAAGFTDAKGSIDRIIGAGDLNYIHKKRLLTDIYGALIAEFGQIDRAVNEQKNLIANNGFFPRELEDIVGEENPVSIQRSVLALESIKFSTALQVFGLMDTFLQQFGRVYGIDQDKLTKYMDLYTKRADIDVVNFLQSCYLNPFEDPKNCGVVDDFAKYFSTYEPQATIDQTLYKELMVFIDNRLDDSAFPSLVIAFDRFDPSSQELGFKIGINTLQDDEKALINQGILNPHIYILSKMINLLKASKFIVGSAIAINDMRIEKNELDIGGKPLIVNSSTRNFTVPLQKNAEREVFDGVGVTRGEVIESFDTIDRLETRPPESYSDNVSISLDDFGTVNESLSGNISVIGNPQSTGELSPGTGTVTGGNPSSGTGVISSGATVSGSGATSPSATPPATPGTGATPPPTRPGSGASIGTGGN